MTEQSVERTQLCVRILQQGGTLDDLPKEKLPTLAEVVNECLGQSDLPVKTAAELSGINNATIHKILNNELHPTRNTLLRLALVMKLSFEKTQLLLKSGNRSLLSGWRERDCMIMDGIIHRKSLWDVDRELTQKGLRDLYSKQD